MFSRFFAWIGLQGPAGPEGAPGCPGADGVGFSGYEQVRLKDTIERLEGELGAIKQHLKIYITKESQPATVYQINSLELLFPYNMGQTIKPKRRRK